MRSDDPLKKLIAEALKHDTKSKHWNVDRDRDYTDFEENDGHQREADALIKHHKYKIDSDAEEDPSWRHLNAIEHYTNDGSVFNHDLIKSKGRLNFRKMHLKISRCIVILMRQLQVLLLLKRICTCTQVSKV